MEKEFKKLNSLISDLLPSETLRQARLATGKSKNLKSPAGIARALGKPLDPDRIRLFESLYEELAGTVFPEYKDRNTTDKAYTTFAFFEGYFSNYIEGTEFTVNEAKEIITTETPIPSRDEDSHDILGTYRIVSDQKEMSVCPTSPDDFLNLMRKRHAILLQSRTSKKPGEFKDRNNRAGNTEFVADAYVRMLLRAYEFSSTLQGESIDEMEKYFIECDAYKESKEGS